jgi:hypothetical protein
MEAIRVKKTVENQVLPEGNPFALLATEDLTLDEGQIRVVSTGLQILSMPSDYELTATASRNCQGSLFPLGCMIDNVGELKIVVLATTPANVPKNTLWVCVHINCVSPAKVRFIQMNESAQRVVTGEGRKIDPHE